MLIYSAQNKVFIAHAVIGTNTSSVDTRHKDLIFWIEQAKTRYLSAHDYTCYEKLEF
jgi:hypothetical protein